MKKYLQSPSMFNNRWKKTAVIPVVSFAEDKDNILLSTTTPSQTINASRKSETTSNVDVTICGERNLEARVMAVISDHDEESVAKESQSSGSSNFKNSVPLRAGKTYLPQMYDVWLYGITTVIGGQYYGWNAALKAGFGSYCIAQFLVGFSYINLTFCLSEIISTTSFSGGAYGMARIVLGFYAGFIVAAFELMEYISYISFSAVYIGDFFCDKLGFGEDYVIVVCFIFHAIALLFVLEEDKWFWRLNYMLAWTVLLILLIYCFGGLGYVNFAANATLAVDTHHKDDSSNWFAGGMVAFMQTLPYTTWGFGGVESGALITDMIDNPRVNLSYGMAYSVCTLFACMIFIMFVACSLPPGMNEFIDMEFFMNEGWNLMGVSSIDGEWLIIPAQIAMAFGFFLPATKLLFAMAQSNLLPHFLRLKQHQNHQQVQDHRLASVYVTALSFLLCILGIYVPNLDLANIPILLGQLTYLSDLYAFYRMRVDFTARDYKFRNPFGITGAIFSACMFILTAISAIALTGEYFTIAFVGIYFVLLTILYYAFAKKHQSFSDDEQKSLLVLHVIKNNQRKRVQKQTAARKNGFSNSATKHSVSNVSNNSNSQWSRLSKSSKSLAVVSRLAMVSSSNLNVQSVASNSEQQKPDEANSRMGSIISENVKSDAEEVLPEAQDDPLDAEIGQEIKKKSVKVTSIIHTAPEITIQTIRMDSMRGSLSQEESLERVLLPTEDTQIQSFTTARLHLSPTSQSGKLQSVNSLSKLRASSDSQQNMSVPMVQIYPIDTNPTEIESSEQLHPSQQSTISPTSASLLPHLSTTINTNTTTPPISQPTDDEKITPNDMDNI